MRDVEFFEQRVEVGLAQIAVWLDDLQDGADVVFHRQSPKDRCLLRQVADAETRALVHREMRHVEAVDLDRPGIGADQPGNHVEDGGLAGAVRSEQADRLAAAERQRYILHHKPPLEGASQPARYQPILTRILVVLSLHAGRAGCSSADAAFPFAHRKRRIRSASGQDDRSSFAAAIDRYVHRLRLMLTAPARRRLG